MRLLLSPSDSQTSLCASQSCTWKPYSHPNDFAANASLLLIIIFSSLICILFLQVAIRFCLRPVLQYEPKPDPDLESTNLDSLPTLVYSQGLNLVGNETECIICLSEFEDGDRLSVLERCKHGFHSYCIQKWVSSSHSSCPTCRAKI